MMTGNLILAARADFGFGNPNLAGALFAMLAVGVWGWCLGVKGRSLSRFWICLGLSGLFSGLMILTASRGAVVALGAGIVTMWGAAGFPRPKRCQAAGMVAALVVLGILVGFGRMGERVAKSSPEDGSITSRVEIFKKVPAMLVAAPQGWGRGRSAEAYQNWFQTPDDSRIYKHLLSTHATWMVERGWGFRFLYLMAWVAGLLLCATTPASLGVWIVYGVAGVFSHVGGDWRLAVLPALALAVAIKGRGARGHWPSARAWRNGVLAAGVVTVGLVVVGTVTNEGISRTARGVRVGQEPPRVWFFAPDVAVLGQAYGKVIRGRGAAEVVWEMEAVKGTGSSEIVLSGSAPIRAGGESFAPDAVTWLNPPGRLTDAQEEFLRSATHKTILWGELRTDANPRKLRAWFETLPGARWIVVRGRGRFLGGDF